MLDFAKLINPTKTPQTEKIPGATQILNSAGGYVYELDGLKQVKRFLCLGTAGGSYYAREREMTVANANVLAEHIKHNGSAVVDLIVEVAQKGLAFNTDPALFALAMCSSPIYADLQTRTYALSQLNKVATIPTHLFHFVKFMKTLRGWGRLNRRAVANWYLQKSIPDLVFHSIKYQQRDGWGNADLIKLSHPKTNDSVRNDVFRYILKGTLPGSQPESRAANLEYSSKENTQAIERLYAVETLKKDISNKEVVKLMSDLKLPIEVIPTEKRTREVYEVALQTNGIQWLVRNLGNLSDKGILTKGNFSEIQQITKRLTDADLIRKSKLHPIKIISAFLQYQQGHGLKGSLTWGVIPDIKDALDDAFYKSFGNVVPANKRTLWGFDISGSMWGGQLCAVPGLSPALASALLGLVTYKVEPKLVPMAFTDKFEEMDLSRRATLGSVEKLMRDLSQRMAGTDCAKPIQYALTKKIPIDTFVISTDSETYAGPQHVSQALKEYRSKMGIQSRMIVVGMTATSCSIADPKDPLCLDVAGFSLDTPELISNFSRGDF